MWCCCRYFLTANLWKSSLLMERKKYSCLATLNPSQCCPEWKHFFLLQMHISHWFCVKKNKKYSVSYQTNKGMNSVVYTVRWGSWKPSVWSLTSHELHLLLHGIAWCKITALALAAGEWSSQQWLQPLLLIRGFCCFPGAAMKCFTSQSCVNA